MAPISPADGLLASRLPLPPDVTIFYSLFRPIVPGAYEVIEHARTSLLSTAPLLDTFLTSVNIEPDPFFYVFKVSQPGDNPLRTLQFDGLALIQSASFAPPPLTSVLPNAESRCLFSHFYDAVRSHLISDIVNAAASSQSRKLKRFKNGFLVSQSSSSSDWEYKSISRPLIFCQLQILFSYNSQEIPSHILVHPTLLPTPFLDVSSCLPLPSGTPITLLPYGTPAYFLATYTGPTAGLIKQFQSSLKGLGAGDWHTSDDTPSFILGWIKVENKQGEDKGITIIYPSKLCLSFIPNSTSRAPLHYVPELPAPLQPSPQVAPALPSASAIAYQSAPASPYPRRPSIFSSPTSESLHTFRALNLSKSNDLRHVAVEVGGYVDAVARERERERERLKRERENGGTGSSPKLTRASATTPASAPTPISVETTTSIVAASQPSNAIAGPSNPPPLQISPVLLPAQMQPSLSMQMQNFYPSPPQTIPHLVAPADGNTSPTVETTATPEFPSMPEDLDTSLPSSAVQPPDTSAAAIPPTTPLEATAPVVSNNDPHYDPYSMDQSSAWTSQPSDAYLGMDMNMDMDMNFGMGMGMDDLSMGMGMNFNLTSNILSGGTTNINMSTDPDAKAAASGGSYAQANPSSGMGMEFDDAFTDDDFSFFDRPARPVVPTGSQSRTVSGSHAHFGGGSGMSPHHFGIGDHMHSAAGHTTATHNGQIWTPSAFLDGFATPAAEHNDSVPPDHLPSSPGPTHAESQSHSAPSTPAAGVHLAYDTSVMIKRENSGPSTASNTNSLASNLFEPIPFASYHRRADGKYFAGKFALPSPPAEDDLMHNFSETSYPFHFAPPSSSASTSSTTTAYPSFLPASAATLTSFSLPPSPNGISGWRRRYDAQTDPRIGVVRKLIGVKRKTPTSTAHATRDPPKSSPWISGHEDWETPSSEQQTNHADADTKSEAESEEEEEIDDDIESPMLSRPTTPPPSYLPLGPSLLHTQFQHAHLLPLSIPLRPPGAAVAPLNLGAGANTHNAVLQSVPTPVSPAATMGAANERSKSLETAAAAVAAEVVENPVWAETWRASTVGAKPSLGVWATDYKAVAQFLRCVPGLEAPVSVADLFELDTSEGAEPLELLKSPMISIGKGEAVIQVLPTALRFWEKLGLDPKGGKKDVSAFVLFEDDVAEQRQTLVETWLANVSSSYQGKHFGNMSFGTSNVCVKDGLVPLRFDPSLRKSLASFVSSLTPPQPTVVVFLILPLAAMSLSSPILRQILSAATKIFNSHRSSVLSLQFIPEQHLFSALERSSASHESPLDQLSLAIYDRLRIPADRLRTRRSAALAANPDDISDIRGYFSAPSFTLARPLYNKVSYVRAAHPSLDVLDRYTLLHVGYHLTSCGRWIVACGVDQRGETHEVGVWLTRAAGQGEQDGEAEISEEEYAVKKVWDFGIQLARKANVEWRMVFARLGVTSQKEVNAWTSHLDAHVVSSRKQPPMHHTLVCVVPDAPWSFIPKSGSASPAPRPSPPGRSPPSSKQPSVFTDVSATTYAIFPKNYIPISIPPSQSDLGLSQSFIPEPPTVSSSPSSPHPHPNATPSSQPTTPMTPLDAPSPSFASPSYTPASITLPHMVSLLPQFSSTLLRVPHASSASTISMTHIHLLRTFHSASYTNSLQSSSSSSARVPDDRCLLNDVTRNFHELAVLAKVRCKLDGLGGHKGLPFHLAAVDAMRMALDRDWDRLEADTEA